MLSNKKLMEQKRTDLNLISAKSNEINPGRLDGAGEGCIFSYHGDMPPLWQVNHLCDTKKAKVEPEATLPLVPSCASYTGR